MVNAREIILKDSDKERLFFKFLFDTREQGDCIILETGSVTGKNGEYNRVWIGGTDGWIPLSHRAFYALFNGGVLAGGADEVDHTCRVTTCINPDHLELVPAKVNLERRVQAFKAKKILDRYLELVG